MKKLWTLLIPLFLMGLNLAGLLLYAQPSWPDHQKATMRFLPEDQVAKMLADIYVLSDPMNDPNDLIRYLKTNPYCFRENGPVTIAARDLGRWILSHDISSLKKDCLLQLENTLQKWNIPDAYASELLSLMKENSMDCHSIGRKFLWLSEVMPEWTDGELTMRLIDGRGTASVQSGYLATYQTEHNSDPEIAELILNNEFCGYRKIADQICLLALISNVYD